MLILTLPIHIPLQITNSDHVGDFNQENLMSVLPRFHQHVRLNNTLQFLLAEPFPSPTWITMDFFEEVAIGNCIPATVCYGSLLGSNVLLWKTFKMRTVVCIFNVKIITTAYNL